MSAFNWIPYEPIWKHLHFRANINELLWLTNVAGDRFVYGL